MTNKRAGLCPLKHREDRHHHMTRMGQLLLFARDGLQDSLHRAFGTVQTH
jgi:hypothetical protein